MLINSRKKYGVIGLIKSIKNAVSSFTSRVRAIVRGWGDLVRKKKYK